MISISGPHVVQSVMDDAGHDPRAVANLLLREAKRSGRNLTHIALQKLLYFAHGIHLMRTGEPLVSGYFEAWEYGPVHPTVYQSFKESGSSPISFLAKGRDVLTRETRAIPDIEDPRAIKSVWGALIAYGEMSPGRLIEASHAENAPWDYVVDQASKTMVFGMRIGNDIIKERFKFHTIAIGAPKDEEEPNEDTPIVGY